MKVFWDGYGLGNRFSGVAVHAQSLARGLTNLGHAPAIISDDDLAATFPECQIHRLRPWLIPLLGQTKPASILRTKRRFVREWDAEQPTILHGLSNFNLPTLSKQREQSIRKVLTVHDLIPNIELGEKEGVSPAHRLQMKWLVPRALSIADRVIVVSKWTRDHLLKIHPSVEGRVHVLPNGVPPFDHAVSQRRILDGVARPKKTQLLCISRGESYKRLPHLVDLIRAASHFHLTVVTDERGRKLIQDRIGGDTTVADRTEVLSRLSEDGLADVYSRSDVYVHPSLAEGFCLPAAEAQSLGIPVVFSSGSGIDEVVEKSAGVGLSPDAVVEEWVGAVDGWAKAGHTEVFQKELAAKWSLRLSWEQVASQTYALYQDALQP